MTTTATTAMSPTTRYNKAERLYQRYIAAVGMDFINQSPKALAHLQKLANELESASALLCRASPRRPPHL